MKTNLKIEIIKKITILLFLWGFVYVNAQQGSFNHPDLVPQPKTPETSSLEKYISVPVSLHTGTPNISIPIYTINYGGMTVPITLSYDASGIKVTEMASEVGLKWSLSVGGAITRIIKGGPDEGSINGASQSSVPIEGYYQDYGISKLKGYFESIGFSEEVINHWINDISSGTKDMEPDLFSFNALGHSGRFFFNQNREIVNFTGNDYKMELLDYSSRNFNHWRVTTPNGIQMTFGNNTNAIEDSYAAPVNVFLNHYEKRAWYMTNAYNPATNKEITFEFNKREYRDLSVTNKTMAGLIYDPTTYSWGAGCIGQVPLSNAYCGLFELDSSNNRAIWSDQMVRSPELSKIKAGEIQVEFIRSDRDDTRGQVTMPGGKTKIDEIIISYKGDCVKRFILNYEYTTSPDSVNMDNLMPQPSQGTFNHIKKRLYLTEVREKTCTGTLSDKIYHLEYYNKGSLPSRVSFAQDKWGYYNGANNNKSLYPALGICNSFNGVANRSVSTTNTNAGTLNKIIFPTGGSQEYVYENHEHSGTVSEPTEEEQWVSIASNNSYSLANNQDFVEGSFTYQYGETVRTKVTLIKNGYVNPCTQESPNDYGFISAKALIITDANTGEIVLDYGYGNVPQSIYDSEGFGEKQFNINLDPGDYNYKLYTYKSNYNGGSCFDVKFRHEALQLVQVPPNEVDNLIGGLRLKEIKYRDQDETIIKTDRYTYSSPKLINNPNFVRKLCWDADPTVNGFVDIIDDNGNFYSTLKLALLNQEGSFVLATIQDPYALNFSGSHITYGNVTEYNSEGYTNYIFGQPLTYKESVAYSRIDDYPPKPVYQSDYAGKLLIKRVFDSDGNLKIRENYEYSVTQKNVDVKGGSFARVPQGNLVLNPGVFYDIKQEVVQLDKKQVKQYYHDKEITIATDYVYESPFHYMPTKIVVSNSNNDQIITKNQYPPDLFSTSHVLNLQHRIANPIKTENYIKKSGNTTEALQSTQLSKYSATPATSNLTLQTSIETSKGDANLEERISFDKYDSSGNLLQYKKTDGTQISYIWSYNKVYPVAKIENAAFSEVATALGISENDLKNFNEANLSQLEGLRTTLPNAMVTTYTYDPLVGVTSMTDPRGYTTTYHYDEFNRLEFVKDAEGNLVSENKYHYKGQSN